MHAYCGGEERHCPHGIYFLDQVSAICGLWTKYSPLPMFVNAVLEEHSHTHSVRKMSMIR